MGNSTSIGVASTNFVSIILIKRKRQQATMELIAEYGGPKSSSEDDSGEVLNTITKAGKKLLIDDEFRLPQCWESRRMSTLVRVYLEYSTLTIRCTLLENDLPFRFSLRGRRLGALRAIHRLNSTMKSCFFMAHPTSGYLSFAFNVSLCDTDLTDDVVSEMISVTIAQCDQYTERLLSFMDKLDQGGTENNHLKNIKNCL